MAVPSGHAVLIACNAWQRVRSGRVACVRELLSLFSFYLNFDIFIVF
jgi:hypothetical protein